MADQPTKAMTLREAVEIVSRGIPRLTLCEVPIAERIERDYMLALKIVDAAVLFVEAQAEVDAAQNAEPFDGQRMSLAWNNSCDTWRNLRALERGEDPKP